MPDPISFVDLNAQYLLYKEEIDAAIMRVLDHQRFIHGPEVRLLEDELAAYTGCGHAITCGNGTDALQLCLMSLGIGPGDEVIVPAFTFIATAEVVPLLGATPVFVDIRKDIYTMCPVSFEQAITPRTRAVIPVSIFGQPADMHEINEIAGQHDIVVIEDAAQSFGATYRGLKSGNLSRLATTSFFPAKPLGCYGDGGAIFTSDDDLAASLRMLRNHGQSRRYVHDVIGTNSRLDTLQAAVLRVKLQHFDDEIQQRKARASWYTAALKSSPLRLPTESADRSTVWAQYTVASAARDLTREALEAAGIPSAVHYPVVLPEQAAFAAPGCRSGALQAAREAATQVLSLPMCAFITPESVRRICDALGAAHSAMGD